MLRRYQAERLYSAQEKRSPTLKGVDTIDFIASGMNSLLQKKSNMQSWARDRDYKRETARNTEDNVEE